MSIKYNFGKLLDAREKVHFKRMECIDKGLITKSEIYKNKIDNLSQRIINEIDNI